VDRLRPSRLLHLAWYAEPGDFWESPRNARWAEASLELLGAFAAGGGERAVISGSCAEYDWSHSLLHEGETPLAPKTAYGRAKRDLGRSAGALCDRLGVSLVWGRVFFPFGPREDPRRLVASVTRALLAGSQAEVTEGRQVRDFLYVEDVGDALATLCDASVTGPVNVASGTGVRVADLVGRVAAACGRPELVRFGARPSRPGEPARLVADVRRLREEVGWRPSVTLEEGVLRTVEWWRSRGGR
jgi:nucleoside-diphosphate-sugar epimerase